MHRKNIKEEVYSACRAIIIQRIETCEQAIKEAQEAAGSETKSTAGDKHETGRAMAHLEQEKNARQLSEAQTLLSVLNRIDAEEKCDEAVLGSVVRTNKGNFFLSVSAGKFLVNGEVYFAISLQSPAGAAMLNCKKEDEFRLNNQVFLITEVF